jgi:hypothetical protein
MTTSTPGQPDSGTPAHSGTPTHSGTHADSAEPIPRVPGLLGDKVELTPEEVRWGRVERKRERIRAEIERNRAGDHRIPTWAMAAALGLILLAWLILLITS